MRERYFADHIIFATPERMLGSENACKCCRLLPLIASQMKHIFKYLGTHELKLEEYAEDDAEEVGD